MNKPTPINRTSQISNVTMLDLFSVTLFPRDPDGRDLDRVETTRGHCYLLRFEFAFVYVCPPRGGRVPPPSLSIFSHSIQDSSPPLLLSSGTVSFMARRYSRHGLQASTVPVPREIARQTSSGSIVPLSSSTPASSDQCHHPSRMLLSSRPRLLKHPFQCDDRNAEPPAEANCWKLAS